MVNRFVQERIYRTKVLVVLDDVNELEKLDYLAGNHDWLGNGSRIIVTTRDVQLLKNIGAHGKYPVEELNFDEANKLFCSRAFRGQSPASGAYKKLSERAVNYAQGLPLALKILGSHLYSKSTKEWESELNKLKMFPNSKVQNVLRVSYDGLEPNEKDIFLDIACFFKCEEKDSVERILDGCNFFVDTGVITLIDRSLITITPNKKFEMHDLVQQMA
ncbi:TMV resistance protein N-like [Morus notabilis]|uniref:TMV resistance protein N-like n=1 Tax=Morus notabilis TaxID=981085 RepID=UPI000CED1D89|nr:TMV resistance protein N-like [Morus notabilis]